MKELFGVDRQLEELKDFILNYKYQQKKAALLIGACGTGKTSGVYHVAEKLGYSVIEFNVSEQRTKGFIQRIARAIYSLDIAGKSIVLLDEADGLTVTGQRNIAKIISKSQKPIVLTANEIKKLVPSLLNKCHIIWFNRPNLADKLKYLKMHGAKVDPTLLPKLPDFRQLNLVIKYGYSAGYLPKLRQEERLIEMLTTGDYSKLEKSSSIFEDDLTYLLENSAHFRGTALYEFVTALAVVDLLMSEPSGDLQVELTRLLSGLKTKVTKDTLKKEFGERYRKYMELGEGQVNGPTR
jgi:SpoVK/Ycf46/Vps4 family AAA+-type ATPase